MQPPATDDLAKLDAEAFAFYRQVLTTLTQAGVRFLIGGAYALERYTGIQRHTKDFDIFVRPEAVRDVLDRLGADGCRTEVTFPHWLAKAYRDDYFIDVIFASGNGLCRVDEEWFRHAPQGEVLGIPASLIPAEEMIWSKSFIQERERYDGADILHVLRACAESLDWDRLLARFGPHWRVLLSHLILFGYVYPAEAHRIPPGVIGELRRRLERELVDVPPTGRLCRGTLLSREQYLIDVEAWGYEDARLWPGGNMTADQVRQWTEGIAVDRRLHLRRHGMPETGLSPP